MKRKNFWSDKIKWQVPGEPSGGAPDPEPQTPPASAPAAEAIDVSFIPETFVKDGKPDIEAFKAHYADLTKAPDVPDAYDFALPDDFKLDGLPEGMTIDIDAADPVMAPLFEDLTGILKGIKAPAAVAQQVTGLLAKYEAAKFSQALAEQQTQMDALGPQATARIEAVTRALQSVLPADQVTALQGVTKSAAALQAVEKLLGPRTLASPNPSPKNAQTEGMTPSQRLAYANSMQAKTA